MKFAGFRPGKINFLLGKTVDNKEIKDIKPNIKLTPHNHTKLTNKSAKLKLNLLLLLTRRKYEIKGTTRRSKALDIFPISIKNFF